MSTWASPEIVDDTRIHHDRWPVRAVAESLHSNESMHMHQDIGDKICVYCALRASRSVDILTALEWGSR